jgi:hypothetical protein
MIRWGSELLSAWMVAAAMVILATSLVDRDDRVRAGLIDVGTPGASVKLFERALLLGENKRDDAPAPHDPESPSHCDLAAADTAVTGC